MINQKEYEVISGLYGLWIPEKPEAYLKKNDVDEDEQIGKFLHFGNRTVRLTTYKTDGTYDRWGIVVEEQRDAQNDGAYECVGIIVIDGGEWLLGPSEETIEELMLILKKNYII